jgi:hypothetical protein
MKRTHATTTKKKADFYETARPLLDAMYGEFKELSKKKPDSAVSASKIKIANRLLDVAREILADEESIGFLDKIDEDDVPQVSDVTLIFSQYVAAMTAFYGKYYGWNGSEHDWLLSK